MTQKTLQKTIYLRATPETVWAFLTQPEQMKKWFHAPNVALTKDARFEMTKPGDDSCFMSGQVLVHEPFDLLEHTFHVPQMGETVSTVRWELTEVDMGTRLSLTHSGLPQSAEYFGLILALDTGWEEHFGQMRQVLNEPVDV